MECELSRLCTAAFRKVPSHCERDQGQRLQEPRPVGPLSRELDRNHLARRPRWRIDPELMEAPENPLQDLGLSPLFQGDRGGCAQGLSPPRRSLLKLGVSDVVQDRQKRFPPLIGSVDLVRDVPGAERAGGDDDQNGSRFVDRVANLLGVDRSRRIVARIEPGRIARGLEASGHKTDGDSGILLDVADEDLLHDPGARSGLAPGGAD